MPTVTIHTGFLYDKIAMPNCYSFGFKDKPDMDDTPVELGDGSLMVPGDLFKKIGGKKTSAGFPRIHMLPGCCLKYMGSFSDLGGKAFLFLNCSDGVEKEMSHDKYGAIYFGWIDMNDDSCCWFHSTPSISGRIIETTEIERV